MTLFRTVWILLPCWILAIGSGLSIQAGETVPKPGVKAKQNKVSRYKWRYKGFFIESKDTQVSVRLTGTGTRRYQKKQTVYSFKLGPLEKKNIKTAGPHSPELKYAKKITFVHKNDESQITVDDPGNSQKAKAAVDITKRFVQYFLMKKELGNVATLQGVGLSAHGWRDDYSEAKLRTERYARDEPVVYTWGEKRGGEEISVWWIMKQYEEKAKFLRLERMSGELDNKPSHADFMKFFQNLRSDFLEGTMEDQDVLSYNGALEVTVCTIQEIEESNREGTSEASSSAE